MAFTDIVGTLFRLLSHRQEIEDLWNKVGPIIKDVLPLVEKVAPGSLAGLMPGTVPPLAPLNPTGTGQPTFSVTWLQETLNKVDNAGLTADGQYGEATKKAVAAFQTKHGLVADGWSGLLTSSELYAALQKMA